MISFRDRQLFSLRDKAGHRSVRERSLPMIHELNRLWKSHRAVSIRIARLEGNRAKLEIDGVTVIETLPGDAAGEDPVIVASRWARALRQAYDSTRGRRQSLRRRGHEMGAIHSREIKGISQPPRRSMFGQILERVAALQKLAQDSLARIPGWPQFVEVTRILSAPVRWLAETTQRVLPFTRRLDWLLEIEKLKSLHPVILMVAIAWAIRRGLFTTQYGHIGTDTLIYPTIATISYFNPFLGVVTGIAFGIGDIVQKLFVDDIFGTTKGDANYHAALLGYCIAYSSLMFAGLLPGTMARIFQLVARNSSACPFQPSPVREPTARQARAVTWKHWEIR